MGKLTKELANFQNKNSISYRFRKNRLKLLEKYINDCFGENKKIEIVDLGGTETFWKSFKTPITDRANITLVNLTSQDVSEPNFKSVIGNACNLPQFSDQQFDLVFSNSVIEHIGVIEEQEKMANEIQRIGKYYFIQTPNRDFFMEPHFLFPFFQFLPIWIKVYLVSHWNVGQYKKAISEEDALRTINSVKMLDIRQLNVLFSGAQIYHERILLFTKSFIVYKGYF